MKLIIQIPCLNEANYLPTTLKCLPTSIEGIDKIETLVIDDGSSDRTSEVAISSGVDYLLRFPKKRGLASCFNLGIETALSLGADIIVTTDGDNQYQSKYIEDLIQPILSCEAEITIGSRNFYKIKEFSRAKKFLQRFGSYCVSQISGISVPDTTSGFRAFSRSAAMQQVVLSNFTYTLETIIKAGHRGLLLRSVPIETNPPLRKSRLFNSTAQYIIRSARDIILVSTQVSPLKTFFTIGTISNSLGGLICLRFIVLYLQASGSFPSQSGYIQSLILASILIIFGLLCYLIGILSDQVRANRLLLERLYLQNRKLIFDKIEKNDYIKLPYLIYKKN